MTVNAPERVETSRLVLRKPRVEDAQDIFTRYASDPEVTRWLSWPRHESIEATRQFLQFSDSEWASWGAGPYLVASREGGEVIGSTGLSFKASDRAETGYVLARDAWGKGYATEALGAVVDVARGIGHMRVYALCHPDNTPSWRVLEKCGFWRECVLREHAEFPNMGPVQQRDVFRYVLDV